MRLKVRHVIYPSYIWTTSAHNPPFSEVSLAVHHPLILSTLLYHPLNPDIYMFQRAVSLVFFPHRLRIPPSSFPSLIHLRSI
jgi:hypothetical protein